MDENIDYIMEIAERSRNIRARIVEYANRLLEMKTGELKTEGEQLDKTGYAWQLGVYKGVSRVMEGDLKTLGFFLELGSEISFEIESDDIDDDDDIYYDSAFNEN